MRAAPLKIPGPLLLEPEVHGDERGFFVETYREADLPGLGIPDHFVQENHSRSRRDTVRGLHFQAGPGQAKLVRVARGEIWDVIVDLRPGSATIGQWDGGHPGRRGAPDAVRAHRIRPRLLRGE